MSDIPDLVHASDDDLGLYVSGQLDANRLSAIEPHVFECQSCAKRLAWWIGSQLIVHLAGRQADERRERSEPRFNTGSEAIVQEFSPLSLDRQTVKIVDISKTGLGILAPKELMPGSIVQIRIKTAVELGEVRHCSAFGDQGYRIGLRFMAVADRDLVVDVPVPHRQQPDRRQAPRHQLNQPAVVSIPGTGQVLEGEIRNLSESGTQIRLGERLRVGSLVRIELEGKLLRGDVVYCRQEPTGWLVGVHLERARPGLTGAADASRRSQ